MIKLGITGSCGKMGRRIYELARMDKDLEVALALEKKGTPLIGKDLGKIKVFTDGNCYYIALLDDGSPVPVVRGFEHAT